MFRIQLPRHESNSRGTALLSRSGEKNGSGEPYHGKSFCAKLIIAGCLLLALTAPLAAEVRTVRVPDGGRVPQVVQDESGVLHMTYGTASSDGFYVQSRDGGKTLSTPVPLNQRPGTVTNGMERGPRVALGKNGVIHVLWGGHYQKGGGVWYRRSTDGGKTFSPERKLNEPDYGLDNLALVSDGRGNVFALWTGGFPGHAEDKESPTASPIILVRSTDDGQTFSRNELLRSDHPASSFACGCCRLEAHVGPDDRLYIAFRGGYKGLRDPYLLVGAKDANQFHCVKISDDQWHTECPMQGVPFSVDAQGKVVVGWMSRQQPYWSASDAGAKQFRPRVQAPLGEGKASYPVALPMKDGHVYVQWQVRDQLHWLLYRADGTATATRGHVALGGLHRAEALLGRDGVIYVVY